MHLQTQSQTAIHRLLIFYAKNSFALRQVAELSAKDLELMGIGVQSGEGTSVATPILGNATPTTKCFENTSTGTFIIDIDNWDFCSATMQVFEKISK